MSCHDSDPMTLCSQSTGGKEWFPRIPIKGGSKEQTNERTAQNEDCSRKKSRKKNRISVAAGNQL